MPLGGRIPFCWLHTTLARRAGLDTCIPAILCLIATASSNLALTDSDMGLPLAQGEITAR